MDLKKANEANPSGYWQIPNSFMKKVRQLSTNELRLKVFELAGALMDQRNANQILINKLAAMEAAESKEQV